MGALLLWLGAGWLAVKVFSGSPKQTPQITPSIAPGKPEVVSSKVVATGIRQVQVNSEAEMADQAMWDNLNARVARLEALVDKLGATVGTLATNTEKALAQVASMANGAEAIAALKALDLKVNNAMELAQAAIAKANTPVTVQAPAVQPPAPRIPTSMPPRAAAAAVKKAALGRVIDAKFRRS